MKDPSLVSILTANYNDTYRIATTFLLEVPFIVQVDIRHWMKLQSLATHAATNFQEAQTYGEGTNIILDCRNPEWSAVLLEDSLYIAYHISIRSWMLQTLIEAHSVYTTGSDVYIMYDVACSLSRHLHVCHLRFTLHL